MKFYMHYKNKPYKLLGTARHSESQEDLALYECRYPNESASVWVRPKDMFFESITLNGKEIPRFRKIPLEMEHKTFLSDEDLKTLKEISFEALGPISFEDLQQKMKSAKHTLALFAKIEGKVVGFKVGFSKDETTFGSWIGGVLPQYRNLGIAADMMEAQHSWAKDKGFAKITTKSMNRFRGMIILNLQFGFDIIGTEMDPKMGFQIVMEKTLT